MLQTQTSLLNIFKLITLFVYYKIHVFEDIIQLSSVYLQSCITVITI